MKKLLIALAFGLLIVAAFATTALADNGPHGGFTNTTEKCAGCHRAHSAQSDDGFLLVSTNVYNLCMSCHKNGAGAYTDAANGVYFNGNIGTLAAPLGTQGEKGAPLYGGGFETVGFAHTWNGKDGYDPAAGYPAAVAVSSTHTVKGIGTGAGTVWGSNDIGAAADVWTATTAAGDHTLECTSCHDPHGRAGRSQAAGSGTTWSANVAGAVPTTYGGDPNGDSIPSYRLLRFTPDGSGGFEATTGSTANWWALGNTQSTQGITVRETANYWYTINSNSAEDGTIQFWRSRYDTNTGTWTAWSSYVAQKGDPAGRNWTYVRPAIASFVFANNATTIYSCKSNGDTTGTLPPVPTGNPATHGAYVAGTDFYACNNPTPGTAFNNSNTTLAGAGAANRPAGRSQLGFWCATCHDKYLAGSNNALVAPGNNSRTQTSGDAYYTFRHNSSSSVPCVDCHAAHGTSSVMTNTNTTYPTASLTTGSILMKLDERSICLKCHSHDVNFQFLP